MKYVLPVFVAIMVSLLAASPAGAVLYEPNPNTALYGDYYLGADGLGDPYATFYGEGIDFDGYVGARPGETFIVHMFANRMDGWPQVSSYRIAAWFDPSITTHVIQRTEWSDTAPDFYIGGEWWASNYHLWDWYHQGFQGSIYDPMCIVSWEFTVLENAIVGSTMEIGLQFNAYNSNAQQIWEFDANYGALQLEILPPLADPGDFDEDGDVDDADIDALCDFIRGGLPYDALYDVSGPGEDGVPDGLVDTNDLDYHVHALVETSVGNGTEYGDFNLDGVIDTTDLTRLATNYGPDDWKWDDGNANRHIDTDIDNTDLTILATYFNFGVPDVIPEPMTLVLVATGAAAVLRKRRSRVARSTSRRLGK